MADVTASIYWKAGQKKLRKVSIFNRSAVAVGTLAFSVLLLFALGIVFVSVLPMAIELIRHRNRPA